MSLHEINQLQISLRTQFGFGSYNPNDPSLSPFLNFNVSELDPSPDYLRCKACKGKLLSGINSFTCVFCGEDSKKDIPPDPLKFCSTIGYRWFLDSLQLDGSEMVQAPVEANESNKGKNSRPAEILLSELLDLEIKWPSQSERRRRNVSNKTRLDLDHKLTTSNLTGVDVENFFSESKIDSLTSSTEEELEVNKHNDGPGSTSQVHGNLSLFENVQPAQTVGPDKEVESGDAFSGWEPEFHSGGAGTHSQETTSFDAFTGSFSADLSTHMDSVFGSGKNLPGRKSEDNRNLQSGTEDWFSEDAWSNSSKLTNSLGDKLNISGNDENSKTGMSSNNLLPMNIDWIQDDQWQTVSDDKATEKKTADEEDDSFDNWNDFTSSTNVQVPSSSNSIQNDSLMIASAKQPSEISLFEEMHSTQGLGSSTPSNSDFFSGIFDNQNGSREAELQPTTYSSDRLTNSVGRDQGSAEDVPDKNTLSKAGDVTELISQMHDLSFMLKSNLSIPQKIGSQNNDSFASFQMD